MSTGVNLKKVSETSLAGANTQDLLRELLVRLGEDPDRDGLVKTPERMQKALEYLTKGSKEDPNSVLTDALFDVSYDEMVIVKDIEMFSLCEHHILPFFGKVHVAYIPNGKVVGLSKIPAWWTSSRVGCRSRNASPCRSRRRFKMRSNRWAWAW